MPVTASLPSLDDIRPKSVTDQVFDVLYDRVVNLTLPPGTKLTEAEVAAQMGVSRQPVRDAFYRLSQLGFINIRPQRATTVTHISEAAIRQAYFVRLALEVACLRKAAHTLTADHHDGLSEVIERQAIAIKANDRAAFSKLDDQFHRDICAGAGLDFVWTLIRENKGHMDRARWVSLSATAPTAMKEHQAILDALRNRDEAAAVAGISLHLSWIEERLEQLRAERPDALGD